MSKIIRERPGYVVVEGWRPGKEERHKRFRCVGGPLDGEMRAVVEDFPKEGNFSYRPFNNAGSSTFSMIYVWIDG